MPVLAAILIVGGLGAAAFHPPAAALAHRLGGRITRARDVGAHHRRHARVLAGPAALRAGGRNISASTWTPLLAIPGLAGHRVLPDARAADPAASRVGGAASRALRPYARPLALLYMIVVLRTLTSLAFATFVPVMLTRQRTDADRRPARSSAVYLFASGAGGFLGGPAADRYGPQDGDRLVARRCRRRSCWPRRCCRAGPSSSCWRSADSSCSRRCR